MQVTRHESVDGPDCQELMFVRAHSSLSCIVSYCQVVCEIQYAVISRYNFELNIPELRRLTPSRMHCSPRSDILVAVPSRTAQRQQVGASCCLKWYRKIWYLAEGDDQVGLYVVEEGKTIIFISV